MKNFILGMIVAGVLALLAFPVILILAMYGGEIWDEVSYNVYHKLPKRVQVRLDKRAWDRSPENPKNWTASETSFVVRQQIVESEAQLAAGTLGDPVTGDKIKEALRRR